MHLHWCRHRAVPEVGLLEVFLGKLRVLLEQVEWSLGAGLCSFAGSCSVGLGSNLGNP